jgi:hypothetical protein
MLPCRPASCAIVTSSTAQFRHRVKGGMQIEEVLTAPQSPWQIPFAERLIVSVRRECLDHIVVLGERHLRRILTAYFAYYHRARTHLSLDKVAPGERPIEPCAALSISARRSWAALARGRHTDAAAASHEIRDVFLADPWSASSGSAALEPRAAPPREVRPRSRARTGTRCRGGYPAWHLRTLEPRFNLMSLSGPETRLKPGRPHGTRIASRILLACWRPLLRPASGLPSPA